MRFNRVALPVALLALTHGASALPQSPPREFFEARIRPVLAEHCYRCHNSSGTKKGRLALDHRAGLRLGGKSGPAIVPGRALDSLLIQAIRHEHPKLRMPKKGPKLSAAVVSDFVKWVDDGAVDPRDKPPTAAKLKAALSWESVRRLRMQWWSFRPVANPRPPEDGQSSHPVDRFVLKRLSTAGLVPAPPAVRRTLLRRVTYALTGLPPTPEEILTFVGDESADAYESVVDRLIASPAFGERWARHWMDWLRYADSHGSEGDPAIPHAWRYRDYLIRAINADVPFDQLVREHIAGDLLPKPRIDRQRGVNESRLGTAQFRFVQHGFAPTDALEEQVRFTDNQIDVLSKAFLGLTVSCARCHDHKFDAIGQSDFYAMYGIFVSCRPATVTIDTPELLATNKTELEASKARIKKRLAAAWLAATGDVTAKLRGSDKATRNLLAKARRDVKSPLHAWSRLSSVETGKFASTWKELVRQWSESRDRLRKQRANSSGWDLAGHDAAKWYSYGVGLTGERSLPGEFQVLPDGDRVVASVLPGGVYSHLLSSKHNGVLSSPRFLYDMKSIYVRVVGDGGAMARYVVRSYPRSGTVYPVHRIRGGKRRWVRWDATYWRGDWGYLELSTAADQAVEINTQATRSWFGITRAVFVSAEQEKNGPTPQDEAAEFVTPLFVGAASASPEDLAALEGVYTDALRSCVRAWKRGTMSDEQAEFLGFFVRSGLLPVSLGKLPELGKEVARYRRLEKEVPVPRRAPGILEAGPFDQPLLVQGDHKRPGKPVRRRFLAAIDARAYDTASSGRLELARDFVRPDNPLTSRVAVNRLWHHLFGRGIVATTDNFGRLGEKPTHPRLLDYLARRFVDSGWSIKKMIRLLVTSETFRTGSRGSPRAAEVDAPNHLLSHFRVRRLEAEAIRDALLAVTGQFDRTMYGPAVSGGSRRRSVYVRVKRNNLDPFLSTFDAPEPHTTRGRREATNVPAQSLTMLNDPFVIAQAGTWAGAILADTSLDSDRAKIQRMFVMAFGREPNAAEMRRSQEFLIATATRVTRRVRDIARLNAGIVKSRMEQLALTGPLRKLLLKAIEENPSDAPAGPRPIANWEFDGDLKDSIGSLHGAIRGRARLSDGALVLDGEGHVETVPLTRDLREKTLEAWVVLGNLQQRGGGVMSVESSGGGVFDSIVFGERDPMQWLPGSNNFRRTKPLGGPVESDAKKRPVHVAITYGRDGTITAYRDGKPYGKSYKTSAPVAFGAGRSVVLFGMRHSPASRGKYLRGRVLRARLYDRALSADEVDASFRGDRKFVSESQVLAAMTDGQRREHARIGTRIAELERQLMKLEPPEGVRASPDRAWQDLAQCLFNFKEFLYVR
jgi:hypothetical protein